MSTLKAVNFIISIHVGAPVWGFREPGDWGSKQPGSVEIDLGCIEKIIQGAGRSGLDYERARRRDPPHAEAHVRASKTFFFQKISV